jgi:hypothetical protein
LIFQGLFFEHIAEIGPRLNIKYGFNWASKKTIYGWTLNRGKEGDNTWSGDSDQRKLLPLSPLLFPVWVLPLPVSEEKKALQTLKA